MRIQTYKRTEFSSAVRSGAFSQTQADSVFLLRCTMKRPFKRRGLPEDRFRAKIQVNEETGCHEWTAYCDQKGYGAFSFDRKVVKAHTFAYELAKGPIPEGLHIDHLCRNKSCVNPEHLEVVTLAENNRRYSQSRTHCIKGHELTEANTYTFSRRRACRRCHIDRSEVWSKANRDKRNRAWRAWSARKRGV